MYLDAFTFPDADAEYAFFMCTHSNGETALRLSVYCGDALGISAIDEARKGL